MGFCWRQWFLRIPSWRFSYLLMKTNRENSCMNCKTSKKTYSYQSSIFCIQCTHLLHLNRATYLLIEIIYYYPIWWEINLHFAMNPTTMSYWYYQIHVIYFLFVWILWSRMKSKRCLCCWKVYYYYRIVIKFLIRSSLIMMTKTIRDTCE